MIVSYSGNAINKLHNLLQNLHPQIKFTMGHNSKELPFVDILIKNENGQIITDIYHKSTDTPKYLDFNSHHVEYMSLSPIKT